MSEPVPQNRRDLLGSPDRFGYEWSTYSTILDESREQLQRWLGSTRLDSFAGKSVLDVGCGMGRNPYWYLKAGAKTVAGVDVDERSLRAARKNLASFSNARVERCSVYDLSPSALGTFDRVTCIGVLHHLADPEEALRKMWDLVAPGGDLVLWCYGREGNRLFLPALQALRAVGARAPIQVTHGLAKLVTVLAWPVLKLTPWQTDYYRYVRSLSFRNIESIIFDQILPKIAHYWTAADMHRLAALLPGGRLHLEMVQENSWHARIERAA